MRVFINLTSIPSEFSVDLAYVASKTQIWSMHIRGAIEYVWSRAAQAALFTVGIPVKPTLHVGPHPVHYWNLMKIEGARRWRLIWPMNYMMFVCRSAFFRTTSRVGFLTCATIWLANSLG